MSCPRCLSEGNNTAQQYWRHSWPCGGILTLDEKARVSCKKCFSRKKLIDIQLKCEEGRHTYVVSTVEGYAAAISTSGHLVNECGMAWLKSVLVNL
ncbi:MULTISPECIES: hypothetical protein [unclassified Chryseobacterium]|uniref:hypothetical protein n=1 Tax=unclassified Chryseobacterium TaxID=2593645 RepID=UPI000F4E83B4|nr:MULTISPECIES: hypothetical protein [unclassified Chryseobacterium]